MTDNPMIKGYLPERLYYNTARPKSHGPGQDDNTVKWGNFALRNIEWCRPNLDHGGVRHGSHCLRSIKD